MVLLVRRGTPSNGSHSLRVFRPRRPPGPRASGWKRHRATRRIRRIARNVILKNRLDTVLQAGQSLHADHRLSASGPVAAGVARLPCRTDFTHQHEVADQSMGHPPPVQGRPRVFGSQPTGTSCSMPYLVRSRRIWSRYRDLASRSVTVKAGLSNMPGCIRCMSVYSERSKLPPRDFAGSSAGPGRMSVKHLHAQTGSQAGGTRWVGNRPDRCCRFP